MEQEMRPEERSIGRRGVSRRDSRWRDLRAPSSEMLPGELLDLGVIEAVVSATCPEYECCTHAYTPQACALA